MMGRLVLVLLGGMILSGSACAGVYGGKTLPDLRPDSYGLIVGQLRKMALPGPKESTKGALVADYLQLKERLEQRQQSPLFDTLDRVNLSACYIRLGEYASAIKLLRAGDQKHFLIQANLATALHLAGQTEQALRHQGQVLSLWPEVWWQWDRGKHAWFRKCELLFLRFLQARVEEGRSGRLPDRIVIDPLFSGVRYVGPGGKYTAGTLSQPMLDRLPEDAFGLVLQLVLWLPLDDRLLWQLGEVLNARGHVFQAYAIMDELAFRIGSKFEGLVEHRAVLRNAQGPAKVIFSAEGSAALLSALLLVPRPLLAPGIAGPITYQVCATGPMVWAPHLGKEPQPALVQGEGPVQVPPLLPFNLKHVLVGFGSGFLVAVLAVLQVLEVRRRRTLARETVELPTPENPPPQPAQSPHSVTPSPPSGEG